MSKMNFDSNPLPNLDSPKEIVVPENAKKNVVANQKRKIVHQKKVTKNTQSNDNTAWKVCGKHLYNGRRLTLYRNETTGDYAVRNRTATGSRFKVVMQKQQVLERVKELELMQKQMSKEMNRVEREMDRIQKNTSVQKDAASVSNRGNGSVQAIGRKTVQTGRRKQTIK